MRLDLGCGSRYREGWLGVDPDQSALLCRGGDWLVGCGERIPLPSESVDELRADVSLPYMDLRATASEIARVLRPGAIAWLKVHPAAYAWQELLHATTWRDRLFRVFVLANGLLQHCLGRAIRLPNGRCDTFQTRHGLRRAFERTGLKVVISLWDVGIQWPHAGDCWVMVHKNADLSCPPYPISA